MQIFQRFQTPKTMKMKTYKKTSSKKRRAPSCSYKTFMAKVLISIQDLWTYPCNNKKWAALKYRLMNQKFKNNLIKSKVSNSNSEKQTTQNSNVINRLNRTYNSWKTSVCRRTKRSMTQSKVWVCVLKTILKDYKELWMIWTNKLKHINHSKKMVYQPTQICLHKFLKARTKFYFNLRISVSIAIMKLVRYKIKQSRETTSAQYSWNHLKSNWISLSKRFSNMKTCASC